MSIRTCQGKYVPASKAKGITIREKRMSEAQGSTTKLSLSQFEIPPFTWVWGRAEIKHYGDSKS